MVVSCNPKVLFLSSLGLQVIYKHLVTWTLAFPNSAFSFHIVPQLVKTQAHCHGIFFLIARLCSLNLSCCFRGWDLPSEHSFDLVSHVVAFRCLFQVKCRVNFEVLMRGPNQEVLVFIVKIYFARCLVWFSCVVRKVKGDRVVRSNDLDVNQVEGKDNKGPARRHLSSVCVDWKQQGARMTCTMRTSVSTSHLEQARCLFVCSQRADQCQVQNWKLDKRVDSQWLICSGPIISQLGSTN